MIAPAENVDFAEAFARLAAADAVEEQAAMGGIAIRMVRDAGGGAGRWDRHDYTAETAIVWSGDFSVEFRDRTVSLTAGQCCVVPANVEHRGKSVTGAEIILLTRVAGG